VLQVDGARPPQLLAERVAPAPGGVVVAEPVKREGRVLAEAARLVMARFEGRHLLISAPPEMRTTFIHDLPKELQQQVADFSGDIHAGIAEVAAAAEPAQRAIEAGEEVATIQRIFEAGPDGASWGEPATLNALWARRVAILAVDDRLCRPGARCRQCGSLWDEIPRSCSTCGSEALEAVEDVVELAIEQALEQRAALELVRSDAARGLMAKRGAMAALLH
jgi:peptide subunit release factor 1 (eRF1)